METIWVFNSGRNSFPSGVFSRRELAEEWIRQNRLSGTLTAYPINRGVFDWAVERGYFKPKKEDQKTPAFIGNFSSASLEHYHYENGEE